MNFKIKKRNGKPLVASEVRVGWDDTTHQVLLEFPHVGARLSADAAREIAGQLMDAADKVEPKRVIIPAGIS